VPTIVQLKGTPTVKALLASVDPFMNQDRVLPVAELRHSTSDLPVTVESARSEALAPALKVPLRPDRRRQTAASCLSGCRWPI